jgi:hypothetical protein
MDVLVAGAIIFDAIKEKTHALAAERTHNFKGTRQKTIQCETQSW